MTLIMELEYPAGVIFIVLQFSDGQTFTLYIHV